MDDVIINKITLLAEYIKRIQAIHGDDFLTNQISQDVATLNLIRACEVCIDIGLRMIRLQKFGIPQSNKDVFAMLGKHQIIPDDLSIKLQKMAGFRNIAIHEYEDVTKEIINSIIENHLTDFQDFSKAILNSESFK